MKLFSVKISYIFMIFFYKLYFLVKNPKKSRRVPYAVMTVPFCKISSTLINYPMYISDILDCSRNINLSNQKSYPGLHHRFPMHQQPLSVLHIPLMPVLRFFLTLQHQYPGGMLLHRQLLPSDVHE